ncbi:hypothetical protein BESB_046910 [Besnoitia besnoiti]|uniref:Uncharacterized protein n=1 Tax=Besnoitia besnoiti TaxID=94643 RepID=A0A2A9MF28_BESBE|nr:hypothetical protein BESB_046910 [Besnoitia besnoiti]PFH36499.1 hypothetical protein BESB_046910 [Besnoitia besnoiti]
MEGHAAHFHAEFLSQGARDAGVLSSRLRWGVFAHLVEPTRFDNARDLEVPLRPGTAPEEETVPSPGEPHTSIRSASARRFNELASAAGGATRRNEPLRDATGAHMEGETLHDRGRRNSRENQFLSEEDGVGESGDAGGFLSAKGDDRSVSSSGRAHRAPGGREAPRDAGVSGPACPCGGEAEDNWQLHRVGEEWLPEEGLEFDVPSYDSQELPASVSYPLHMRGSPPASHVRERSPRAACSEHPAAPSPRQPRSRSPGSSRASSSSPSQQPHSVPCGRGPLPHHGGGSPASGPQASEYHRASAPAALRGDEEFISSQPVPRLSAAPARAPADNAAWGVSPQPRPSSAVSSSARVSGVSSTSLAARAEARRREQQMQLWERLQEVRREKKQVFDLLRELDGKCIETLCPSRPQSARSARGALPRQAWRSAPSAQRGRETPSSSANDRSVTRGACDAWARDRRRSHLSALLDEECFSLADRRPLRRSCSARSLRRPSGEASPRLPWPDARRGGGDGERRRASTGRGARGAESASFVSGYTVRDLKELVFPAKPKKRKPWDDSLSDLSRYRASPAELLSRRLRSTSPHAAVAAAEYRMRLHLMEQDLRPFIEEYKLQDCPGALQEEEERLIREARLELFRRQRASVAASICSSTSARCRRSDGERGGGDSPAGAAARGATSCCAVVGRRPAAAQQAAPARPHSAGGVSSVRGPCRGQDGGRRGDTRAAEGAARRVSPRGAASCRLSRPRPCVCSKCGVATDTAAAGDDAAPGALSVYPPPPVARTTQLSRRLQQHHSYVAPRLSKASSSSLRRGGEAPGAAGRSSPAGADEREIRPRVANIEVEVRRTPDGPVCTGVWTNPPLRRACGLTDLEPESGRLVPGGETLRRSAAPAPTSPEGGDGARAPDAPREGRRSPAGLAYAMDVQGQLKLLDEIAAQLDCLDATFPCDVGPGCRRATFPAPGAPRSAANSPSAAVEQSCATAYGQTLPRRPPGGRPVLGESLSSGEEEGSAPPRPAALPDASSPSRVLAAANGDGDAARGDGESDRQGQLEEIQRQLQGMQQQLGDHHRLWLFPPFSASYTQAADLAPVGGSPPHSTAAPSLENEADAACRRGSASALANVYRASVAGGGAELTLSQSARIRHAISSASSLSSVIREQSEALQGECADVVEQLKHQQERMQHHLQGYFPSLLQPAAPAGDSAVPVPHGGGASVSTRGSGYNDLGGDAGRQPRRVAAAKASLETPASQNKPLQRRGRLPAWGGREALVKSNARDAANNRRSRELRTVPAARPAALGPCFIKTVGGLHVSVQSSEERAVMAGGEESRIVAIDVQLQRAKPGAPFEAAPGADENSNPQRGLQLRPELVLSAEPEVRQKNLMHR